jgi:Uma2 family endonuclease
MPAQKTATRKEATGWEDFFEKGDEATWEVAYLFPAQGRWTLRDYLRLEKTNLEGWPRIEFCNGRLEVLPGPAELHQIISGYFFTLLHAFTQRHAPGSVLFNGVKLRLASRIIRYPDILYLKIENYHLRRKQYWRGADLVMEVLSPGSKQRERDLKVKKRSMLRRASPSTG